MELQAQAVGSENTSKPEERFTETAKGIQRDLHGSLPVPLDNFLAFRKHISHLKNTWLL